MSVPFLLFGGPGEADWTCGEKAWGRSVAPLGSGYNLAPTSLCAEITDLLASVCLNSSMTGTSSGRASPRPAQLLAFAPGKEQAAGVWEP